MSGTISIADWGAFGPTLERGDVWLRLRDAPLLDIGFRNLPDAQKAQYLALAMLSSRMASDDKVSPEIPNEPAFLTSVTGVRFTESSIASLLESGLVSDRATEVKRIERTKSRYISKNVRDYVTSRDRKCLKCGAEDLLEFDHVVPVSNATLINRVLGGKQATAENIQLLCRSCNHAKRSVDDSRLHTWALSEDATDLRKRIKDAVSPRMTP